MSFKESLTRAVSRQTLVMKKNSPHLLFAGGVIGVVAGTVLACKATLRSEKMLDEIKTEIDEVKASDLEQGDLTYVYGKSAVRIVKAYAPAIAVTGGSLLILTGAHVQLARRNAALTVAYATLHRAYLDYRGRVREAVGPEKELDLYHGVTLEQAKDEAGKPAEFKTVDVNNLSPYARFFDEGSPNWNQDSEYNRIFIQCQQNYANNLLIARGHLFLNEVYDMLGINRSSAGQVVGWVINSDGDNYVDFNMFQAHQSGFVNGHEPSILLDFNVDGVVYDKI